MDESATRGQQAVSRPTRFARASLSRGRSITLRGADSHSMRRGVPLLLVVLGLLIAAPAATSSTSSGAQQEAQSLAALQGSLVREINTTRANFGLKPLTRSSGLVRAATAHTEAMFERGVFEHEFAGWLTLAERLQRYFARNARSWSGGENLAYFQTQPTARDIVQAWLDSPPHRSNLLSKSWKELGIAVQYQDAAPGDFNGQPTWLITLDLGRRG